MCQVWLPCTPGFAAVVLGNVPTFDRQPVLPLPGVPGVALVVQGGTFLYIQPVWSKSLLSSQNAPAIARKRHSSGVLRRNSCCWCWLSSTACQVALGEKQVGVRLASYRGP